MPKEKGRCFVDRGESCALCVMRLAEGGEDAVGAKGLEAADKEHAFGGG